MSTTAVGGRWSPSHLLLWRSTQSGVVDWFRSTLNAQRSSLVARRSSIAVPRQRGDMPVEVLRY